MGGDFVTARLPTCGLDSGSAESIVTHPASPVRYSAWRVWHRARRRPFAHPIAINRSDPSRGPILSRLELFRNIVIYSKCSI